MRIKSLALVLSLPLIIGGCSTLGTNLASDFSCDAPEGRCAPTQAIDDEAINQIEPYAEPARFDTSGIFHAARANSPAQEGTLKIVFPQRVDSGGRIHQERVVLARINRTVFASAPNELERIIASSSLAAEDITALSSSAANNPQPLPVVQPLSRESLREEVDGLLARANAETETETPVNAPAIIVGLPGGGND